MLKRLEWFFGKKKKPLIDADKEVVFDGKEVLVFGKVLPFVEDSCGNFLIGNEISLLGNEISEEAEKRTRNKKISCVHQSHDRRHYTILMGNTALNVLNAIVTEGRACMPEHIVYLLRKLIEEEKKTGGKEESALKEKKRFPFCMDSELELEHKVDADKRKAGWVYKNDKNGYFSIRLERESEWKKENDRILCRHYNCQSKLENTIVGTDAAKILYVIACKEIISERSYFLYLAKELTRAQNALETKTDYLQDLKQSSIAESVKSQP